MPSNDQFISDFCETINKLPVIEMTTTTKKEGGKEQWNLARYYYQLTPEDYSKEAARVQSVGFVAGLDKNEGWPLNELVAKKSSDRLAKHRNIIVFDADLKDNPGGIDIDRVIAEIGPECWYVLSTGHGYHLGFKLKEPIALDKQYSRKYTEALLQLQPRIDVTLDQSCKNVSRIFRLPFSTNYKREPVATALLWSNLSAFYDASWAAVKVPEKKVSEERKGTSDLQDKLTFIDIMEHFKYDKWGSCVNKGDETLFSSPFREDKNPSFSINAAKGVFKDFASGECGDEFNLIAYFMGKDLHNNPRIFTEIKEKAKEIIGPEVEKEHKEEKAPEKKKDIKLAKYKYFKTFFDKHIKGARKNKLGKNVVVKDGQGGWTSVPNLADTLASHAVDEGYNHSLVTKHLDRYMNDLTPELLVDIPKWDGRDRIAEILKHVKVSNVEHEVFIELFKDWAARIFTRLENPKNQNRLIILKGDQGIGKDHLIQNLFGGFEDYFQSFTVNKKSEENHMIMTQSLVLNIAEFDQTAKIHVSMLKDMITKDSALFRTPYKRAPESHPFYCSFISTSNASDLLRDHTGNRRFIIFEVDSIDWSYAKRCEAQLLAQYHSLYKSKFRASQEANDAMTKFIGSQTPDNPEDLFIDEFQDKMRRENKYNGNPYIEKRWEDISDWAIILGKSLGLRERQMQMAIKRRGMSKKIGRHMFYVVRNDELAN